MDDRETLRYPPPKGPPLETPEEPLQSAPTQWPAPVQPGPVPTEYIPPRGPPPSAPTGPGSAAQQSLLARAKIDDQEALATMFAQFLPRGEQVVECHYLGVLGFWGVGTHSFAAVTKRRVASLRISLLGGVDYRDGSLEYVNSAAVFQPSKAKLYLYAALVSLVLFGLGFAIHPALSIVFLLLSLLALPLTARLYYRWNKSGIVLWVREGLHVYAFIDRKRMRLSNQLYRLCADLREERLSSLGQP